MKYKSIVYEQLASNDNDLIVEHILSTERRDRDGDVLKSAGARVIGKPVVLLCFGNSEHGQEPVAKPLSIDTFEYRGKPAIKAKTQFYDNQIGRRLYQKTTTGFMPFWAVGYQPLQSRPFKDKGYEVLEWDLLNYSIVGVSSNPDAQTISKFYKSLIA